MPLAVADIASLGADLLYHWEVPADPSPHLTLDGSDATLLADRGASAAHMTVESGAMVYRANGGPNNAPYLEGAADTGGTLSTAANFAELIGVRVGLYVVMRMSDVDGSPYVGLGGVGDFTHGAGARIGAYPDGEYASIAAGEGGAWMLLAIEYLATGCTGYRDNVALSPNFEGSATVAGDGSMAWSGNAGDAFALSIVVRDPDAAKRAIVMAAIASLYGQIG